MPPILEQVAYSLRQFTTIAQELHAQKDKSDFIRFVLTGDHDGQQAVIDPIQDALLNVDDVVVNRDYDSLIGVSERIEPDATIYIFPAADKADTLSKSVHFDWTLSIDPTVCRNKHFT